MAHDGFDLAAEVMDGFERADSLVADMARLGRARAEAERAYRVAKRERILHERAENGTPVGLVGDLVKGCGEVSLLALRRDCAEAEYEAAREALLVEKRRIDWLRELWAREWGRPS